ncbi:harmonin-binding protein USHBP1 isoform X3 [Manis pentadactyla]|uniref:harmonin-binding protein USHBP1 isoform X3 n=1 Tax=Manis pentadactyla TaxID=143292 RepID=UPI00255C9943|nr:harmonin-binding protein USHBP1 isoform X3 [Manis pentadactyla]
MSARATRPRSRRGRHALPGELDPVAEEAEAASVNSELGPQPSQDSCKPELLGPKVEASVQGLGSRTDKKADGDSIRGLASVHKGPHEPADEAHQAPEAAPQDTETVPYGPGAPDVFQTLEHALSSLEAAAAAWRCQPPSCPGLMEAEDRSEVGPSACLQQEAGSCQGEVARLTERNAWLRLALGCRHEELTHMQASLQAVQAEKEMLQREVQELQDSLEPFPPPSRGQAGGASDSGSSNSGVDEELWGTQDPFSLAHPMIQRLCSDSSIQTLGSLPIQPHAPEMHIMEAQMERLRGSIEKLKCFNRLLSAVLRGYKGQCEGLSMQLGRRESEATALHLALQYSPEGSSVHKSTPQEVATRLQGYVQCLQDRRALVKIPPEPGPTLAPMPTVPRAEAMVKALLGTQPGPALPRLEKMQIQQDLAATRETLADLLLRLQLVQREKRGLELREAALRAQGPAHTLLLEQLQWEQAQLQGGGAGSSGGDSSGDEEWSQGPPAVPGGGRGTDGGQVGKVQDPEELSQELEASLTRALGLQEQLQSLREELEHVAQKGRARRAQSAELNSDLCKAHSALVLAFRGAHRKQEERQRKMEQQMAFMKARQAEELAVLEATMRALQKPRPPSRCGETLL